MARKLYHVLVDCQLSIRWECVLACFVLRYESFIIRLSISTKKNNSVHFHFHFHLCWSQPTAHYYFILNICYDCYCKRFSGWKSHFRICVKLKMRYLNSFRAECAKTDNKRVPLFFYHLLLFFVFVFFRFRFKCILIWFTFAFYPFILPSVQCSVHTHTILIYSKSSWSSLPHHNHFECPLFYHSRVWCWAIFFN